MQQDDQSGPSAYKDTPQGQQQRWGREMTSYEQRTRRWHKSGTKVQRRFTGDQQNRADRGSEASGWQGARFKLNLFNTNIITLQSMLFGQIPKTDVSRRFADPNDDVARVSSEILQRMLDTSIEKFGADFTDTLKQALQDRLLPGLGVARIRYVFETETEQVDAVLDDYGVEMVAAYEEEVLVYEDAPVDYVQWKDFAWGYGRTWKEVPWVAFRSYLDKDEVEKRFGKKKAQNVSYTRQNPTGSSRNQEPFERDMQDPWQKAEIWEIWSLLDKKVYWFNTCLLYTSPSPRDRQRSRMPSSA